MNYKLNQEIAEELGWFIADHEFNDLLAVYMPDGTVVIVRSIQQFEENPDIFDTAFEFYTDDWQCTKMLLDMPAPVPHNDTELGWSVTHYNGWRAIFYGYKYKAYVGHVDGYAEHIADTMEEALAGAWLKCWRQIKKYWSDDVESI